MKQFFLFFSFLLFSAGLFANNTSEFFIQMEKPGYYSVAISDQTLIASSNHFRFFDLAAGQHTVKVSDIMTGVVVYTGNVILSQGTRKVVRLDQAWRLFPVADVAVNPVNWYTTCTSGNSGNTGGWGQTNTTTTTQSTTIGMNGNSATSTSTTSTSGGPNSFDFASAKKQIENESFDTRKLEKAKSITAKTMLTSDQIAELCTLFSFDNNRLEYAKFAYDYCSDKVNYFKVSSTFAFSSNARELEKYTKNR